MHARDALKAVSILEEPAHFQQPEHARGEGGTHGRVHIARLLVEVVRPKVGRVEGLVLPSELPNLIKTRAKDARDEICETPPGAACQECASVARARARDGAKR